VGVWFRESLTRHGEYARARLVRLTSARPGAAAARSASGAGGVFAPQRRSRSAGGRCLCSGPRPRRRRRPPAWHPRVAHLPPRPTQAVDTLARYCGREVPIKRLLLWLEMARQSLPDPAARIPLPAWQAVLQDLSS
jgi:hypothetical protein